MDIRYTKETLTAGWVLAIGAAGVTGGATSPAAWMTLAVLVLVPLVVMWRLWTPPAQTLSESIHDARR